MAPITDVEALGSGAIVELYGMFTNSGAVFGSGGGLIEFDDVTISGGTLSGANGVFETTNFANIDGADIAGGVVVDALSGTTLYLSGGTVGSGATVFALSGGTAFAYYSNVVNSGTLEAASSGTFEASNATLDNFGTIEAAGSGATALISASTVDNAPTGVMLASGSGATLNLQTAIISGGTFETVSGGVIENSGGGGDNVYGAAIGSGSLFEAIGALTWSGGTLESGAVLDAVGSALTIVGTVTNSGGTLFADASSSRVEITSGTVVNGGITEVGDGIVEFFGPSDENVAFQTGGSGRLHTVSRMRATEHLYRHDLRVRPEYVAIDRPRQHRIPAPASAPSSRPMARIP